MSKLEFIRELERLLQDIPMDERQEALQYYEGYFDDAGQDREQIIIVELGSPAKVAASIKADLFSSTQEAQSRGYFTEKGYEDEALQEPKFEILDGTAMESETKKDNGNDTKSNFNAQRNPNTGGRDNTRNEREEHKSNDSGSKIVLIILLCIFAIPVGIPIIATVFSLFLAAFCAAAGIFIAFIIISVVFTIIGVALTFLGLIKLFTIPFIGICLAGVGLILFGIGLLFTMVTIALGTKVIPAIIRGFVNICKIPFRNRSVMA